MTQSHVAIRIRVCGRDQFPREFGGGPHPHRSFTFTSSAIITSMGCSHRSPGGLTSHNNKNIQLMYKSVESQNLSMC